MSRSEQVARELNCLDVQAWSLGDQTSLAEVIEDYFLSPCDDGG